MRRLVLACASLSLVCLPAARRDDAQQRFVTSRSNALTLPLPEEREAFSFVVFGDRTGGPAEGLRVLGDAVAEVNLIRPDLVMTVGDLVNGYNESPAWIAQANEFKGVMQRLACPWFPVVGNHDIYWRGKGARPAGEHERDFETHFGPLWYAFRHKQAWFIALYSDEGNPQTGEKNFDKPECQRIGAEQFEWLRSTLALASQARHVFVFLHHPRWLAGNYGDDWERVHRALVEAGNVRAVFAGHIHHMRYDGPRDGIEYFTLATVGGEQSALVPRAGYLHEYHLVTVRDGGIAVAALPVGSAFDPRAITGALSADTLLATRALVPRADGALRFDAQFAAEGELEFEFSNAAQRPLEVELELRSDDLRWSFTPDHAHRRIAPGARAKFTARAVRPAASLDELYRAPQLVVRADYLAEGLRIPLPARTVELPLDTASVPLPRRPERESVLELDGVDDCVRVEHARLALPDGPFTVEGWLEAREFRARQGFINKTEASEFGLFVDEGRPAFTVHLAGDYVGARAAGKLLETGRWHHLAGVYDGTQVRLYVDGVLAAAKPGSGVRTQRELPLLIGADVGADGSPNSLFPGRIDEIRVSRGVRYTGANFTPARRFEPDDDTLLLLHADGDLGPWSPDDSPRRLHALRSGGAHAALVP